MQTIGRQNANSGYPLALILEEKDEEQFPCFSIGELVFLHTCPFICWLPSRDVIQPRFLSLKSDTDVLDLRSFIQQPFKANNGALKEWCTVWFLP